MAFCRHCGQEVKDEAVVCPHCGCPTGVEVSKNENQPSRDTGSIGWGVLGFFIPLVGLILFLCWKDSRPMDARYAGRGALIGFIINVVITIASYSCLAVVIGSGLLY